MYSITGGNLAVRRCMWIPPSNIDDDRHHHIYFRCGTCRPLKRACQYFGHLSDIVCNEPKLATINDSPVCRSEVCSSDGFMIPTHCFYQTFSDVNGNRFFVFFQTVKEVESFFQRFPAKLCLQDDRTWCKFLTIMYQHRTLLAHSQTKMMDLTVREVPFGNDFVRCNYVAGFLSDLLWLEMHHGFTCFYVH